MRKKWIQLIIETPEEQAEEVSYRIMKAGTSAVEQRDGVKGASLLITHIPLEDGATSRLRAIEALLATLGVPKNAMTLKNIADEDWVARARGHFRGEAHGKKLWIRPPWDESETPEERVALLLEPGLAFGTGKHPSTRLALLAVEAECTHKPPGRVVDVGCGSGILGVAALLYGARRAVALDLDPRAVEETRALAKKNGVSSRIAAHNASLGPCVLKGWWGVVDFIAANVFLDALAGLAPLIHEALACGGRGVLSGIGYEQTVPLVRACKDASLVVEKINRLEEWASLEIRKL